MIPPLAAISFTQCLSTLIVSMVLLLFLREAQQIR